VPSLHSNRGAKRAREAREALGFTRDGPLPDLIHVIEERGGAHVVLVDLPEGVAGAYAAKPDCPLLFVNGGQAIPRQRFTLAHEFGHFRMGHSSVVDKIASIGGFDHNPTEVEANAFAAEFLMPRDAVLEWGKERVRGLVTLDDVVRLAYEYGVSAQAARYALGSAGVLTDERRCQQLDEEISEELHIELAQRLGLEPLQDELADAVVRLPRIPAALAGSALGDLLVGHLDVAGLAARLGRPVHAVDAMLVEMGLAQLLPA
jgi:Zn-dependent peptidase ImmA (M78 family)